MKNSQATATNQNWIKLINDFDSAEWKIDSRIINFSKFLSEMEVQIHPYGCVLQVVLPSFLKVTETEVKMVIKFLSLHNYEVDTVRIDKIKINGFQKQLDQISLNYIKLHLKQYSGDIKVLLNFCEYLKIDLLKKVICTYLASFCFFTYKDSDMKEQLQKKKIFYSRQQQIDLKTRMVLYAKETSKDILQNLNQIYLKDFTNK